LCRIKGEEDYIIRTILTIICLCLALPALAQPPKLADGKPRQFSRDIRLTDVLNHRWVDELVTYTLELPVMAPPAVEILDSHSAFRLISPGKVAVDYAVAGAGPVSARADDFRFTGQYGVGRVRDGRVSVSLIDGTEIRCREIGVFGKGPVSLEQTPTGFRGTAVPGRYSMSFFNTENCRVVSQLPDGTNVHQSERRPTMVLNGPGNGLMTMTSRRPIQPWQCRPRRRWHRPPRTWR